MRPPTDLTRIIERRRYSTATVTGPQHKEHIMDEYTDIMADVHQKAQKIETWVIDCLSMTSEPVTEQHVTDAKFVQRNLADLLKYLRYKPLPTQADRRIDSLEKELRDAKLAMMEARRGLRRVVENMPANAVPRLRLELQGVIDALPQ